MEWQSPAFQSSPVDQALTQASQRAFMSRVYRWMFAGLGLTGAVALYTVSSAPMLQFVRSSFLFLLVAEFGLVLAMSWLSSRVSATAVGAMFVAYAALNGLTLSSIFLVYRLGSISEAFFTTAAAYGALSVYGTVTKRDLTAWRSFLVMGLFGVVIAGVVNMFIRSAALSFVWSCACVLVFAGLTAYDTQKLRELHALGNQEGQGSLAIRGALTLYLDFVNFFLAILRLFGRRR